MPVAYTRLGIKDIHDSSTWNLHPFLDNDIADALQASIAKVGVLHPPVLVQTKEKTCDIVSGRKRVRCAQLSGMATLFCAVLPETTPVKTLLTVLLEDQAATGPLSQPEAATFIKLCRDHLDKAEALEMFRQGPLPQMDPQHLLRLLAFDNLLLRRLHFGQLTDRIVPDLLWFDDEARNRIVCLIDVLQLGANKQKRLISLCRDIMQREDILLASLLDDTDIMQIIEHPAMNTPQKINRLFEILRKRCFPRSTAAMEIFCSRVRELSLPRAFTLTPSPYFERDEVTLSIGFPDLASCERALPSLKGLVGDDRRTGTGGGNVTDS